ncbi:MAG: glycosyltransferase [Bacteroidetes bacterium]|nr:glycosyltransferase [Bacteroidota bacterium]
MPKVSICIPTYLQVEFLRLTLNSVIEQDFEDYEVIISDDSPDDSVKNLVQTYNFKNRLRYFKNDSPLGSPENWNKAVDLAIGEYVKILHHDDFFTYRNSLSKFVEMLDMAKDTDFGFSATLVDSISLKKKWVHCASTEQLQELKKCPEVLFFGNIVGPPSSTIYRNTKIFSYDKRLKWIVDLDFYIECLLKNRSFGFSKSPLITSISGASHNVTKECENNMDVEIFEYLTLYYKIKDKTVIPKARFASFFENLFKKYDVNSLQKIRDAEFKKPLPLFLYSILHNRKLKKNYRILKRVLYFFKQIIF